MKPKIWGVALGALLLLSLTACVSESTRAPYDAPSRATNDHYTGKKIALVIGNWAYRFKPLNNPQNDARDMAQLLSQQLGFEVIHKENLGFDQMLDEVIKFKLKLKGQIGLFYFAGHGLEVQKENYLLPTDLPTPETELVKSKSIRAQWVVNVMEHSGSKVNIVILDACRKFPRPDFRDPSEEHGLAAMSAAKGTIIGFATGSNKTASDGKKGTNGLYTGHLLKFMRQPGLTIEEVFKKTRQQVAWETRNKAEQQVPWVSNSLIGDFCLVSCAKPKRDQEKILQAQLEQERREKEALLEQERQKNEALLEQERRKLEQERREKEALQAQLKALKNQPKPVIPQPPDEFAPSKVFRDRLADGSFGPEMVWIPAGSFRMGDIQGGGDSDEQPVHRVSVERFAMGRYEVTNTEFVRFLNAVNRRGSKNEPWFETKAEDSDSHIMGSTGNFRVKSGYETHPVREVSWYGAVAYTKWLSQQTGKQYRLPTEAEWEYAARAGTETARYWGNDPDKACGYANVADQTAKQKYSGWTIHNCTDGYVETAPVGQFKQNKFGLYDMLGNLWEWTCSEFESKYSGQEQRCTKNVNKNNRLSLRGGSWVNGGAGVRSANRNDRSPTDRVDDVGLRVARLL
jgi:formylglycine-generating enzyme required for sulfatase activity